MSRLLTWLVMFAPTAALAQGWNNVGKPKQEVVTWAKWWTEPLFSGFWMAWTRASLAVFIFVFASIAILALIELRHPGGAERKGVLGLVTTRGDRLFIGLLGAVYIFLAWIGVFGMPVWTPLVLAFGWLGFCFWKV